MIKGIGFARAAARRQLSHAKRVLEGRPGSLAPLGSATLDISDVRVARQWLQNPASWDDPSVVAEYERSFARWNGSAYAFAFMGGRVALSACIDALDLQPGDEALVPGYTCVVAVNAFRFAGVKVVFGDIELDTYGLDVSDVQRKLSRRTKAILLHHLYGLVSRDYEAILELARDRGVSVIEDCAHSTGAEYHGVKVGNRGDCAFYSSEQSKVFNTVEGGLAVTNDERLARRLADFHARAPLPAPARTRGVLKTLLLNYYQFAHPRRWATADWAEVLYGRSRQISTTPQEEAGVRPSHYGQRMPAPLAAVGIEQLRRIDRYNEARRRGAARWDEWCDRNGFRRPMVVPGSKPVFLRYPVLVSPQMKRDHTWSKDLNVQVGVWFRSNIHPVSGRVEGCPNADSAVERCINFPCLGV